jgi:hypothetical protein
LNREPILMTKKKTAAAALLLCLPLAAAAAQHITDIAWSDGTYRHAVTVAPGRFFEACGALGAGVTVRWQFEASAPLDFNIHYHEGKDVVYPARLPAVAQASDTLAVKLAQDYCWMWTNRGAASVKLELRLQR